MEPETLRRDSQSESAHGVAIDFFDGLKCPDTDMDSWDTLEDFHPKVTHFTKGHIDRGILDNFEGNPPSHSDKLRSNAHWEYGDGQEDETATIDLCGAFNEQALGESHSLSAINKCVLDSRKRLGMNEPTFVGNLQSAAQAKLGDSGLVNRTEWTFVLLPLQAADNNRLRLSGYLGVRG